MSIDQIETLKAENARLRALFPKILAALGTGAWCSDDASVEFMQGIPKEVEAVVLKLKSRHGAERE